MSRDKLIIFGVVLLGLLGVLVYKQVKTDAAIGAPPASSTDYPRRSAPRTTSTSSSITNGEKGEVVLERVVDPAGVAGDAGPATKWVVTKPVAADASQTGGQGPPREPEGSEGRLEDRLEGRRRFKKEKQLDASHGLHLVAWKDGTRRSTRPSASPGSSGTLVMVEDKPDAVWAAKSYSIYLYTKDAKDFREKEIFKFDDANVTAIEITNPHGALAFKRDGDKWTGTFGKKPIEHFDEEKIKSLLSAFKGLNADDFGDGKPLADTGLDKPEAQITFQLKDDANAPYTLFIGGAATAMNRYAKRPDRDVVYQITNYVQEWVTSDATKFVAATDGGAPAGAKAKGDKADAGKK